MAYENSPSSIMYAELKSLGLSNHDVAATLLDTDMSFGSTSIGDRIKSRSRLSRDIVHVAPGGISIWLFRDFRQSCQKLLGRIISKQKREAGNNAVREIAERLSGESAQAMQGALREYGIDDNVYRNALGHISNLDLDNGTERTLLLLILFVVTGCTGDPSEGARITERFSADIVGSSFRTVVVNAGKVDESDDDSDDAMRLGLMRIVGGKLKGPNAFYRLAPTEQGTEIGTLASSSNSIADVDEDVSRHHARVYLQDGHWYIIGLKSTNGTTVISGKDNTEHVVEPPRGKRPRNYAPEPYEIFPTDTICLGISTRFMVMPTVE